MMIQPCRHTNYVSWRLMAYLVFVLLVCGFFIFISSVIYASYIVLRTLIYGVDLLLITVILLTSGIQILAIGIVGEYVGGNYLEAKRRPLYIVDNEY